MIFLNANVITTGVDTYLPHGEWIKFLLKLQILYVFEKNTFNGNMHVHTTASKKGQ